MAQRFIACDREQSFLMPPDVRECLPEDHFAWFVLGAVEAIELDAFYASYRADGRSRPAFDPAMMLALLLYAYARGVRSSRAIERACVEDVAYRVIAAQSKPDHATIARFLERHQTPLAEVFGDVLALCAKAGLVAVNVVAVDGKSLRLLPFARSDSGADASQLYVAVRRDSTSLSEFARAAVRLTNAPPWGRRAGSQFGGLQVSPAPNRTLRRRRRGHRERSERNVARNGRSLRSLARLTDSSAATGARGVPPSWRRTPRA
jgi:transposase